MKKFVEILDEITATRAAITEADATERKLVESYCSESDLWERCAKKRASEADLQQIGETLRDLKLKLYLLKHNAKVALYAEAVPVALEVLKKYEGKPYGEKTREKISAEVAARTGCRFSIGSGYSQTYNFYPVERRAANDFNITVGPAGGDAQALLKDNKIQVPALCDLSMWYNRNHYFEDIPGAICEMKTAYDRAVRAREELEAACSAFNVYAVGGMSSLNPRETIYKTLRV